MFNSRNEEIKRILDETSQPKYVLSQIYQAIYSQGVEKYTDIFNLNKNLRNILENQLQQVLTLKVISTQESEQTQKFLFETRDGHRIESVLMTFLPNKERKYIHNSLCVSSQSGCGLGCKFCATGAIGFKKNLTQDEIVDQVLYFKQQKIDIHTLFFSGMGEPFANPNLFDALNILTSKDMLNFGERRISISTVGIVEGIINLTLKFPQINLAFSLHSPFAEERAKLMPITKKYPIEKVLGVLTNHVYVTNRKVFIAYMLIDGFNDTADHANALVKLIKSQGKKAYLFHVNLIKYHPAVTDKNFKEPSSQRVNFFKEILEKNHIEVTLRRDFGLDIEGACGQLYARYSR